MSDQGDLFGARPTRPVKPIRPVRPVRPVREPEPTVEIAPTLAVEIVPVDDSKLCPLCDSPRIVLLSVVGTISPPELAISRSCSDCEHRWVSRIPRTDVCPHGVYRKVPCSPCGRTWAEIEAGSKG